MTLADDVRRGLTAQHKAIPSIHFYDAAGSALFDEITRQPEYYLTETERGILKAQASAIVAAAAARATTVAPSAGASGPVADAAPVTLVELGAGSADKTRVLIEALLARQGTAHYVPIDVSRAAVKAAAASLEAQYPALSVDPLVTRNSDGLAELDPSQPEARLVLFIGSSIGNFGFEDGIKFMQHVASHLRPHDTFLLGTDMLKDQSVLLPAYDDAAGVTTRFNLNLLTRINRELDADFDLEGFDHEARFNADLCRMESHLIARRAMTVNVRALDLTVRFAKGEGLHTENSYKYTDAMIEAMVKRSGFVLERSWFDERRWFGLHLMRVVPA